MLAASRATRRELIFRGDRWREGLDQSGRDDRQVSCADEVKVVIKSVRPSVCASQHLSTVLLVCVNAFTLNMEKYSSCMVFFARLPVCSGTFTVDFFFSLGGDLRPI